MMSPGGAVVLRRQTVRDDDDVCRLYDVSLQQALPAVSNAVNAFTIEQCVCPPTYTGLSCQVLPIFIVYINHRCKKTFILKFKKTCKT